MCESANEQAQVFDVGELVSRGATRTLLPLEVLRPRDVAFDGVFALNDTLGVAESVVEGPNGAKGLGFVLFSETKMRGLECAEYKLYKRCPNYLAKNRRKQIC